jgi:DNA-binding transcriptional LysR family regulator
MKQPDVALLAPLDALLQEVSVTRAARRMGISTPAMSHTLARLREQLGDPLLVRAGRQMVLTPRAEGMREKVRRALGEAVLALEPERPFSPRELRRSVVIHASDHVLTVLGVDLDRLVHRQAPELQLRFVPNTPDDPGALREGSADLSVGIYGDLPPELRTRLLLTDRFVCVVRTGHPAIKRRLSLAQFVALEHVQVAPRGKPGGYLDDQLAERGLQRRVVLAVPFFLAALRLTAETDYVLTISERIARVMAPCLGLRILEPPLELRPYGLRLVWHPRFDRDAGHQWLREQLLQAAKQAAGDQHADARTSLDDHRPRGRRPRAGAR